MASPLTQRALTRISDSGFARAKKLATLAIKTNVDSKGKTTTKGYESAIAALTPYLQSSNEKEAIDAQIALAGYNNDLNKISTNKRDQNEAVSSFKLQEADAYFTKFDGDVGSFRNPTDLVDTTSESLDTLLVSLIDTIDQKKADGESTDALYSYYKDLNKRASDMRDLRNKFQRGELPAGQSLDGYGYYVDTDPITGQVRGAALIPVNNPPAGLTDGYRRLDATSQVGESMLPVYAPAQKTSDGSYVSRVGSNVWSGTGEGSLTGEKDASNLTDGKFAINDATAFPLAVSRVDKGSFVRGYSGKDAEGNPVESIYYRGQDNKLYNVDQTTIEEFKKDPLLANKLNGYVQQVSPSEIKELQTEAQPFTPDRIGYESKITDMNAKTAAAQAESDRLNPEGFFAKAKVLGSEVVNELKTRAQSTTSPEGEVTPRASFFDRTNVPNKPDSMPTGENAKSIIDTGKKFFNASKSFLTK